MNLDHEEGAWQPSVEDLRNTLGLAAALASDNSEAIRRLSRQMTLEQCALSCLALSQMLLRRLAEVMEVPMEELADQLRVELGHDSS